MFWEKSKEGVNITRFNLGELSNSQNRDRKGKLLFHSVFDLALYFFIRMLLYLL